MTDFAADLCERLDANGREWMLENTASDGRYPKIWDRARIKQLQKRTGARIISVAMCEWGLGPPEEPTKRHRKLTSWM
eukprot:8978131-Pyramimonas_sp.AAC.1